MLKMLNKEINRENILQICVFYLMNVTVILSPFFIGRYINARPFFYRYEENFS